jgi:hypothetical protein
VASNWTYRLRCPGLRTWNQGPGALGDRHQLAETAICAVTKPPESGLLAPTDGLSVLRPPSALTFK